MFMNTIRCTECPLKKDNCYKTCGRYQAFNAKSKDIKTKPHRHHIKYTILTFSKQSEGDTYE